MATYELAKTIEARKLNPRSKLPLPEPPVTIPYGAVLTGLEWLDGLARFHYLGELYQCEEEVLRDALGRELAETPKPAAKPATERPAPSRSTDKPAGLVWEDVPSNRFHVFRARIPGGWLVAVDNGTGVGLTFLADPKHDWEL